MTLPTSKQLDIIAFVELYIDVTFTGETAQEAYDFIGTFWQAAQCEHDQRHSIRMSSGFLAGDIARESIPDDSWVFNPQSAPEIFNREPTP